MVKKMGKMKSSKPKTSQPIPAAKEVAETVEVTKAEAFTNPAQTEPQNAQPANPPVSESPAPSIDPGAEAAAYPDIDLSGYESETLIGKLPPIEEGKPIGEYTAVAGCLTKEQFFRGVFKPLHDVPAAVFRLESLSIKPEEETAAQGASNALYDIAAEVELFRFLIQPGNIWLQRAIAIGAFTVPKAMGVRNELVSRQMKAAVHEEVGNPSSGE